MKKGKTGTGEEMSSCCEGKPAKYKMADPD